MHCYVYTYINQIPEFYNCDCIKINIFERKHDSISIISAVGVVEKEGLAGVSRRCD